MTHNHLAQETSPYLLQHANNPVHWYPWGAQATAAAKARNVPILLSVGYAACHWCHVMAHESFEDEETAAVMNELFVNVKVDREERPDVDAIYMTALHSLGEQGGWPLTMFLTPEGAPFWGGTYFPRQAGFGRPSFKQVLREISRIYAEENEKVAANASAMKAHLTAPTYAPETPDITQDLVIGLAERLTEDAFDPEWGGLKGAPKFPQYNLLWLLWRAGVLFDRPNARKTVRRALTAMCEGGIYDHLGGGFARYAVDERWLVPHFEKMLYDNALLVELLTDAWRDGQNPVFAARVGETVEWLLREMRTDGDTLVHGPGGTPQVQLQAFSSSYDADSEGEEGKFYVWDAGEIRHLLGEDDFKLFSAAYGVTAEGNWEGKLILNRLERLKGEHAETPETTERLAAMRDTLWRAREDRVKPALDDKILADWNGLAIAAVARAARVFRQPDWYAAARNAFRFVQTHMMGGDGRLHHSFRAGRASAPATSSDYANLIWAALRLHCEGPAVSSSDAMTAETPDLAAPLDQALQWQAILDKHYWVEGRGYALTADDTDDLFVRPQSARDDAVPNANAVAIANLSHLHLLTGDVAHLDRARALGEALRPDLARNLVAHAGVLAAACDLLVPQHVAVIVPETVAPTNGHQGMVDEPALLSGLHGQAAGGALEQIVIGAADDGAGPALAGKPPIDGLPTAYVCTGATCSLPITNGAELAGLIRGARSTVS